DKFTLFGNEYSRKACLADEAKARKERSSHIWTFGEDLLIHKDQSTVYYCYLCEKEKREQRKLLSISNGNTSAINHLQAIHKIDRKTG
ncbi:hypothetical protein BJ546DRAFT_813117, partial [Cryomyces antarcticus]